MENYRTMDEKPLGNPAASIPQQSTPHGAAGGETIDPVLPPPYSLEKVTGYENVTFNNAVLTPPAVLELTEETPPDRGEMSNAPHFTEEDVREAVARFASEHCCYGGAVTREMQVTEITMSSSFRYILSTFGEKRESAWRFVPYIGQRIDGPSNGPAPAAWDVPVRPQKNFKNSLKKMEVPHTAIVKPCHVCVGNGRVRCENCRGRGRLNSPSSVFPERCYNCDCKGQVNCRTCGAKGNLKGFVELTVTWKNHVSEYISDISAMPKELVRNVTGQMALQEDMPKVSPVTHAVDSRVRMVSNRFITKHNQSFPNERTLRQYQQLQIVPIAICSYKWRDKSGNFCVYGFEQKVHFPDYPQKCCCGCNIL